MYIFVLVIIIVVTLVTDLFFLLPAALVGGVWLVVRLIKNFDTEFEYIVTNGELDIDQIIGKRKRKRLLTIDSRLFEIVAPDSDVNFSPYNSTQFRERIDASSRVNPRYFAVCPSKQGGKLLLYFEPNDRILDAVKMYNPRAVNR
jgi:hypothetical protein